MRLRLKQIIPPTWNIRVHSKKALVALGQENLKAMRAEWRRLEDKITADFCKKQIAIDFLTCGSYEAGCGTIPKKESKSFCDCGSCSYATTCMTNRPYRTSAGTHNYIEESQYCELLQELGSKKHRPWRAKNEECVFKSDYSRLHKRIARALRKDIAKLRRQKKIAEKSIYALKPLIDEAELKPVFSSHRQASHFAGAGKAVVFMSDGRKYRPYETKIVNCQVDSKHPYIEFVAPEKCTACRCTINKTTKGEPSLALPFRSALILRLDEYEYIMHDPIYMWAWLKAIPNDAGARTIMTEALASKKN